jgi:hypothetical protein
MQQARMRAKSSLTNFTRDYQSVDLKIMCERSETAFL